VKIIKALFVSSPGALAVVNVDTPTPAAELASRPSRSELAADPQLWALLQEASGGAWSGCVYDQKKIAARLHMVPATTSS